MKRLWLVCLGGLFLSAQQADAVILIESSHYTCGAPLQTALKALSGLCGHSEAVVKVGVFSYSRGGRPVRWLTTPTMPLSDRTVCQQVFSAASRYCDTVPAVALYSAIEQALEQGGAPTLILVVSGQERGSASNIGDIQKLARHKGVSLYAVAIGWSGEGPQKRLKDLVGYYDRSDAFLLATGNAPDAIALQKFVLSALGNISKAKPSGPASAAPSSAEPTGSSSEKAGTWPQWFWMALVGAGVILLVGVVWLTVFSGREKAQAPVAAPPVASVPTEVIPPAAPARPPVPTLRRLVIYYPHGQQSVNLSPSTAPITIGRAPDNTLVISDPTVSARHARLYLQGMQWYVQDLGSTNGTFVNEARVTQHPVQIGDKIRVGAIVIHLAG